MTAANNTVENFLLVFGQRFEQALLERMDRNHEVVFKYLDNPDLSAEVVRAYGNLVQTRAKVAYQEHCPIGELLGLTRSRGTCSTRRPCGPGPGPARCTSRWRRRRSRPSRAS
jgi:hypothetical protein